MPRYTDSAFPEFSNEFKSDQYALSCPYIFLAENMLREYIIFPALELPSTGFFRPLESLFSGLLKHCTPSPKRTNAPC